MDLDQLANISEERDERLTEDDLDNIHREVSYAGHTWGLRTLYPWEEAMAAEACKKFRGSLKEPDIWMAAVVGLACEHEDGSDEFCPRSSPDDAVYARQRMQYMAKKWHFPFLEKLYLNYVEMQGELLDRIERVENLYGEPTGIPVPSASSWSDQATSFVEDPSEIPD